MSWIDPNLVRRGDILHLFQQIKLVQLHSSPQQWLIWAVVNTRSWNIFSGPSFICYLNLIGCSGFHLDIKKLNTFSDVATDPFWLYCARHSVGRTMTDVWQPEIPTHYLPQLLMTFMVERKFLILPFISAKMLPMQYSHYIHLPLISWCFHEKWWPKCQPLRLKSPDLHDIVSISFDQQNHQVRNKLHVSG